MLIFFAFLFSISCYIANLPYFPAKNICSSIIQKECKNIWIRLNRQNNKKYGFGVKLQCSQLVFNCVLCYYFTFPVFRLVQKKWTTRLASGSKINVFVRLIVRQIKQPKDNKAIEFVQRNKFEKEAHSKTVYTITKLKLKPTPTF